MIHPQPALLLLLLLLPLLLLLLLLLLAALAALVIYTTLTTYANLLVFGVQKSYKQLGSWIDTFISYMFPW